MHRSALLAIVAASLFLPTCGGGGSGKSSNQVAHIVPNLAVFFVSGHNEPFDGNPSPSYLDQPGFAGPDILAALQGAGFSVAYGYYVDDAYPVEGVGGYQDLVYGLESTRDQWVPYGTRVIVVAHSHGAVWAHAAIRSVSNIPITCEVDLDACSYGWSLVGHDAQNDFIGGEPRDEFYIPYLVYYPQYPNVPSESTDHYDIEDVVFPNVLSNLEVRSGDSPPLADEWFDEKWSIRSDGSVGGLYGYYSGTTHDEVCTAGSATLTFVKGWLLAFL